jgi:hypothetical protein
MKRSCYLSHESMNQSLSPLRFNNCTHQNTFTLRHNVRFYLPVQFGQSLLATLGDVSSTYSIFHAFSLLQKLPYDVRAMIWDSVVHQDEARNIILREWRLLSPQRKLQDLRDQSNPSILSVNKEARRRGLLRYKPIYEFETEDVRLKKHQFDFYPVLYGQPRQYYVRPDMDMIVIKSIRWFHELYDDLKECDACLFRENIKFLEIRQFDITKLKQWYTYPYHDDDSRKYCLRRFVNSLSRFKVLEKVKLITTGLPFPNREYERMVEMMEMNGEARLRARYEEFERQTILVEKEIRDSFEKLHVVRMYCRQTVPDVEYELDL